MATTPDLGIPFIDGSQFQPDVTLNEAIVMLQAMMTGVITVGENDPPTGSPGPQDGDAYIVGTSPTGAWVGRENCIAIQIEGEWRFVPDRDSDGSIIAMGERQEGKLRVWSQFDNELFVWADSDASPGELEWRTFSQLSTDLTGILKGYAQNVSNAANSTECTSGVETTLPMANDGANQYVTPTVSTGRMEFDVAFNGGNGGFIVDNLSEFTDFDVRVSVVNLDSGNAEGVGQVFLVDDKTIPGTGVAIKSASLSLPQNEERPFQISFFHGGIEAFYPRINCAATRDIQLNGVYVKAQEPQ
jgi:hypothetical protein